MKCIFSGQVFSDPDLKLKSRCIVSVGFDVATDLIPAAKVKLVKDAAGPIGRSAGKLASDLAKTKRFNKQLLDGLENLGKALTLVEHSPRDVVGLFLTSDTALKVVAGKLGAKDLVALNDLRQLQAAMRSLFLSLTGLSDVEKCKEAFSPSSPSAAPIIRDCGTSRDGWLVGPFDSNNEAPYEVTGPRHINMSRGMVQAAALLKDFPVQEFNTHFKLNAVPCAVAQAIAVSASRKGWSWPDSSPDHSGSVAVELGTSGGDAHLGTYYCTGRALKYGTEVAESCAQKLRGGKILGSFVVQPNPYYS